MLPQTLNPSAHAQRQAARDAGAQRARPDNWAYSLLARACTLETKEPGTGYWLHCQRASAWALWAGPGCRAASALPMGVLTSAPDPVPMFIAGSQCYFGIRGAEILRRTGHGMQRLVACRRWLAMW